ncbi:MAG TPA: aspartate aminotransferase family protein [Nannocystis exedens]|nr:aspartate aminotransferase family protein [Nannocystis exedens]
MVEETPWQPYPTRAATVASFASHVNRGKAETFERYGLDLVMGARAGARFVDAFSGRSFLNCHCNGGVFNLGHRNEVVIRAARRALARVDIGNHHLVSGHRALLAERLAATTKGQLSGAVFGVSGGEAVDLALKVARAHTGRSQVLSASGGYHGHTGLALATGDAQYRAPFGPNLAGFDQLPFGTLEAMEQAIDGRTAAVILEPIPATLGMPLPPEGYLEGVAALCRARGALLILDEVQTGLGRTGRIWAYQHENVEPDMIVIGKGLSGGIYPITATLMRAEIHRFFDEHPFVHISTFGGAEIGCAAAGAVLDVILDPAFLPRVAELAERFAAGLAGAPFKLRQRGLFMGLQFDSEGAGMVATKMLYERGIFALYANNDRSVLQLLPPLTASDDDVEEIICTLREVFG